jgi:toxin ParE1/3/4
MSDHVLSPRAQADLDEIWDYSARHWGEDRAERYVRDLWRGIEYVASDPRRGRSCEEIRAGYFKYLVGSHVVFYRLVPGGMDVVRILHQRMDFERHL